VIQILDDLHDKVIGLKLSGKLHDEDYDRFVPLVDQSVEQHGKVRMLVEFHDFHGWSAHALWDDIVFSASHCLDIDRIAMIGENDWQKWMAKVCKPFTKATIKYFEHSQADEARAWVEEGL
jgi:hypothetical protein